MNQELKQYITSKLHNLPALIESGVDGEKITALNKVLNEMHQGINFDTNVEILMSNNRLLTENFKIKIKEYLHAKETIALAHSIDMDNLTAELGDLLGGGSVEGITSGLRGLRGIGIATRRLGPTKRRRVPDKKR